MKPFTIVAIVVFVLASLGHLARFALGWEMVINGWPVPMEMSLATVIVAGFLAFMLWREMKK